MIISTKAIFGCFNPKKIQLHKTFRTRLIPKTIPIIVFLLSEFAQAKYNASAIKKNRIVQAIRKTKFGGVICLA